jgi:short-subunit dehydrogenase
MAGLAVITGASSGIGQAYAERLAGDGWGLAIVGRRRSRLEELAERLKADRGVDVRVFEIDLSDREQLDALRTELASLPVDMLVNNAGLAHYMPFSELPEDKATELVDTNVLAPVLLTRSVLPGMLQRGKGAVINIASLLAFSGPADSPHLPRRAVYAGSKAFIVAFTQVLATELRGTGVRVQVVCPGVVRTEFHSRQGMDMTSAARMEPDDVVRASLFDLERGEVLSAPPLVDVAARDRLEAAQREMLTFTRIVELPERYR